MSGSKFEDDQISGFDDLEADDFAEDVAPVDDTPVEESDDFPPEAVADDEMVDASVEDSADESMEAESDQEEVVATAGGKKKTGLVARVKAFDWSTFTVFDGMLMVALICVSLATMWLFFELRNFGEFPFAFPWRTPGY